jgi:hypothetical protein
MKCPSNQCGTENPEGNHYCGACGTALDTQSEQIARAVAKEVKAVLTVSLKERSVVEVEVAESIAKRLIEWAKVFGIFAGVPLVLLIAILTILGVNSFADFKSKLKAGMEALTKAAAKAEEMEKRQAVLTNRYAAQENSLAKLERDIPELQKGFSQITQLQSKVNQLEDLGLGKLRPLDSERNSRMQLILDAYAKYLSSVGFIVPVRKVSIFVFESNASGMQALYYDNRICLTTNYLDDPIQYLHEFSHHVLIGPDGKFDSSGIETALASYLPLTFSAQGTAPEPLKRKDISPAIWPAFSNEPNLSFNTLRTLPSTVPEILMYNVGELWLKIFWELRKELTPEVLDPLLADTWRTWEPIEQVENYRDASNRFGRLLISRDQKRAGDKNTEAIKAAMRKLGLDP